MRYQKRLSAPKHYPISKKDMKYVEARKGSHRSKYKIPLLVILRDVLGIVRNKKEAKKALNEGKILLDGKRVKDTALTVGFMDVISIPSSDKYYRLLVDHKGPKLTEIPEEEANIKICRVEDKKILKGGKIQLNLHDSKNLLVSDDHSTRDSLVLKLPEKNIDKVIEFKEGNLALISSGKHAGELAKIKEIHNKEGSKPRKVTLENESEFETVMPYVFVVGENKPEVTLNAEE